MPTITFAQSTGEATEVTVEEGTSLMRAAVTNGIEGIVGECGGQAMCATCHVYVRPEFAGQLPGHQRRRGRDARLHHRRAHRRLAPGLPGQDVRHPWPTSSSTFPRTRCSRHGNERRPNTPSSSAPGRPASRSPTPCAPRATPGPSPSSTTRPPSPTSALRCPRTTWVPIHRGTRLAVARTRTSSPPRTSRCTAACGHRRGHRRHGASTLADGDVAGLHPPGLCHRCRQPAPALPGRRARGRPCAAHARRCAGPAVGAVQRAEGRGDRGRVHRPGIRRRRPGPRA